MKRSSHGILAIMAGAVAVAAYLFFHALPSGAGAIVVALLSYVAIASLLRAILQHADSAPPQQTGDPVVRPTADSPHGMQQPSRLFGDCSRYIGKRLLVGISYEDQAGKLIRQEQFHGLIVEAGEGGVVIERNDTGERKSLPPELMEARPGEYRLRTTGDIVVDPDYLAQWVMKEPPPGGAPEVAAEPTDGVDRAGG